MAETSPFGLFGFGRKLDALAAQNVQILKQLAAILAAVNAPAWLTPPATAAQATTLYPPVIDVGGQIYSLLNTIIADEGKDMAAIDDLNAAVTSLTTEVGTVVTEMNTLMADLTAALAAGNSTAIETAVTNINAQVAALQAAVTADTPPAGA
jgi:hypothetical protein